MIIILCLMPVKRGAQYIFTFARFLLSIAILQFSICHPRWRVFVILQYNETKKTKTKNLLIAAY